VEWGEGVVCYEEKGDLCSGVTPYVLYGIPKKRKPVFLRCSNRDEMRPTGCSAPIQSRSPNTNQKTTTKHNKTPKQNTKKNHTAPVYYTDTLFLHPQSGKEQT